MATITPDRFDPLKRYIGVRLQQGVPIVDADWNELQDVRKFEVQAFLKWYVKDGVPDRNDGFRIVGTGLENDFVIRAGVDAPPPGASNLEIGLGHVGRCIVDGMDVLIEKDSKFTAQPLHADYPESAALALEMGVPQIAAMTIPNAAGTVVAYLDVWERLVTSVDDPNLKLPRLGVETCVRTKREWAVRVRDGELAPSRGEADYLAGHSYYALARIARRDDPSGTIDPADVVDLREQRLLMPPATLIPDVLGIDPEEYRRGQGRPAISLRQAINALIRGETLGTPETRIAPTPASDDMIGRGTFFDAANGLVTTWYSNRSNFTFQIFASRLSLADPDAGFAEPPQRITDGVAHTLPHAVPLDTGEVLVVYQTLTESEKEDIYLKRVSLADPINSLAEIPVADAPARERAPFAVPVNGQVVIFWHEDPSNTWQFKRFDLATNSFPGNRETLSTVTADPPVNQCSLHAAKDSSDNVWVAFLTEENNIYAVQLPPGGPPTLDNEIDTGGTASSPPFVLVDLHDNVWVFWSASSKVWSSRLVRGTTTWELATAIPGTDVDVGQSLARVAVTGASRGMGMDLDPNLAPVAVIDAERGIWLFWQSDRSGLGNNDIWYVRRHPVTGDWGEPRQITAAPENDTDPFVLCGVDGTMWVFWRRSYNEFHEELFFRRILTSI